MKVRELIENLQKCNPESEIIMELDDMERLLNNTE